MFFIINTLSQSRFHWKSQDYLNYRLRGRDKTIGYHVRHSNASPKDFLNLCYLTCSRELRACVQDEDERMGRL